MKKQDNAIARIADMTFAVIVAITKLREISPRLHGEFSTQNFGFRLSDAKLNDKPNKEI